MAENRTVKVTLKAEVAAYLRDIVRSADATEKLGASATGAGRDIDKAMAQSNKSVEKNTQVFDRWGKVSKLALAGVVLAAGGLFAAMVTQGVNANSFAEQNQEALATMLGSAEAAKQKLDEVYGLATDTPFQFPQLTAQYKNFIAAQLDLDKVIPLMRSYSAAVATLGGDSNTLASVADAFQDMVTLGRAQGDQLNRLTEQGIPAWRMLAEAAGTSVAEVQRQASEGMITAEHAVDVLTAGMDAQFGSMLDNMGNTYARWQDKVAGAQRRTAEQMTTPIIEVGKEAMRALTGVFNAQTAALKGADWDPIIEPLMTIPEILDEITASISTGGVQEVIDGVGKGLALMAEAGELVFRVAQPLLMVLAAAVAAGTPLLELLTMLMQGFNALPAPVQAMIVALGLFLAFQGPMTAFVGKAVVGIKAFSVSFADLRLQAMMAGATLPGVTAAMGGITSGARAAGAALLTAFGGPIGLAVAGGIALVTAALFSWTAATQEQDASIAALSGTLDQNTAAITNETRRSIVEALDTKGALADMELLGIRTDDVVDGILNGGDGFDSILDGLRKSAKAGQELAQSIGSTGRMASEAENGILREGGAAERALSAITGESDSLSSAIESVERKARAAGNAVESVDGAVSVDTSAAQANLDALTASARTALSSFIDLSPNRKASKKSGGGGGGGGGGGQSAAAKAAKAEQAAVKKSVDAAKKAADEYEKASRKKARAAEEAADETVKAAEKAKDAETSAVDAMRLAADRYVSSQRQRQAIEITLANTTDPARKKILTIALGDAIDYERRMLEAKTVAEGTAATATQNSTLLQADAIVKTDEASAAQAAYEAATLNAARVQDESSRRIEAAAAKMAAATESSSSRAGGAVSGFAEDAKLSLQEYMAQLEKQVKAQEKWRDNMIALSGRVSSTTIAALMEMGSEGASLVAEMVDANDSDLARMDDLFSRAGSDIASEFARDMDGLGRLVPEITRRFGSKSAEHLKSEFRRGRVSVDEIMSALGAEWDGKKMTIKMDAKTQDAMNKAGGLMKYIASLRPVVNILATGQVKFKDKNGKPLNVGMFAEGGAIRGPGGPTDDRVPILASNGEHMWTTAETNAVGGHAAMHTLRRMALRGALKLAGGGPVSAPAQMNMSAPQMGGGINVHQTIYYPVAEPSSKTANRGIQEAMAF